MKKITLLLYKLLKWIVVMRENGKKELDNLSTQNFKYSDELSLNYYDYCLSNLAKKIKAECLKFKKQDLRAINP